MKWFDQWNLRFPLNTVLWLLLLGFVAYRMWPQAAAAFAIGATSGPAPSFAVRTLDGDQVSLENLRGQVVLVNFWATWCPPCRVEMPGFERVYRDRKADGFTIIGLSVDQGGASSVRAFLAERGITFPVAMATGEVVREFGGVRALPTSLLIDRHGRVRHQVPGLFAEPALRLAVVRLLDEEPSAGREVGGGR